MPGYSLDVVKVKIDEQQLANAAMKLRNVRNGLPRAMAGAINDTNRQEVSSIRRAIKAVVNLKLKDVNPYITCTLAGPSEDPKARIYVKKTKRIPLQYFGARQTKQGVTYQISRIEGRKLAKGAFGLNIAKLSGNVFRRVGKKRLPLTKRFQGPSAWGVYVKSGMLDATRVDVKENLKKNLDNRVRFELLKSQGLARGRQDKG